MNIIVDKLQAEKGGAEKVLKELCHILRPSIIYTTTVVNEEYWKRYLGVEKIKSPIWGFLFKNRKIWFLCYPLICLLYSFNKLDGEKTIFCYSSSAGKFLGTRNAKAYLYTNFPARGIFEPEKFFFNNVTLLLIKPLVYIFSFLEKRQYKKFYKISCISTTAKIALSKYCDINSEIINCPISGHWFESNIINSKVDYLKSDYSYVILSRLTAWKNLEYIFEYFDSQETRTLTVIGDGDLFNYYKKKYTRQCRFIGYVEEHLLKQEMAKSFALIFPSKQEWGLPLVEANASGLPVVALNSNAVIETQIIDEENPQNGTCITFASQKEEEFKAALYKCESTKWNHDLIIKNSKKFTPNNFKKNIINFIEDI